MKVLYFFQLLLISFETLAISIASLLWSYFSIEIGLLAATISFNDEVLKYMMVVPLGLAVWVANELKQLLHEDKEITRFLVDWPEYWKLKFHVWVSLIFALIFVCLSIAPWIVRSGISTGGGFLLFLTSIVGQLSLAASVYAARLRMKEVIAHAPKT
jgi:hypothetical protein